MRAGRRMSFTHGRHWLWLAGIAALLPFAVSATGQPTAGTSAFENARFHFSVKLPAGCRHEEGPGTVEAVCSPELDPDKSAEASAASSLVMEVVAERVADGSTQQFGEGDFRQELPETVCGESDGNRVKIDNLAKSVEDARVVYSADVTCPSIRFLALGERRAIARYLITPGVRYRLMARAPAEEYEQRKNDIDAFLASFQVLAQEKRSQ